MSQVYLSSTGGGGNVDSLIVATDSGNASPSSGNLNLITPGGGTQGIMTTGSGNTITVTVTPSGLSGTGQTIGAVNSNIVTFALGATPGTYTFDFNCAGFDSATPGGVGYSLFATVRTTGAAGTLIGASTDIANEEAGYAGANAIVAVSGNNALVTVTGVAGKTINWAVNGTYVFAS